MSTEEMALLIAGWFKEVAVDVLRAWFIMYSVATIIAYHMGV